MDKEVYTRQASYYETDQMGIVHHSNYIRYFEDARIRFMHNIGCDIMEMENKGLFIPNVDAYARYKKPIKFSDDFIISVKLVTFTGSRMVFEYNIVLCKNNEIAATGHTTHCFTNCEFKPVSIKHTFPEYFQKLKNNIQSS